MEKIINRLIIDAVEGCDVYHHNKSTWLIFTDTKQWVVELTGGGTLWYNYNFFHNLFKYVSLDVVDNQQYITKWVESFIKNGVKRTMSETIPDSFLIEDTVINGVRYTGSPDWDRDKVAKDTLENGVRHTDIFESGRTDSVDDIIQDGVKETSHNATMFQSIYAEDAIQNGVKETIELMNELPNRVKKIIKKGVKKTKMCNSFSPHEAEDVIKNGVRDTQSNPYENESWIEGVIKKGVKKTLWISAEREKLVETTLNNGVKETNHVDVMGFFNNKMEDALQNGVKEIYEYKGLRPDVKDVIQDGVKEVQPLPDQSGEIIGYGNYYHGKEDRTKAFIDYLEETIKFGVKKTYWLPKEHKLPVNGVSPIDEVINEGTLI